MDAVTARAEVQVVLTDAAASGLSGRGLCILLPRGIHGEHLAIGGE